MEILLNVTIIVATTKKCTVTNESIASISELLFILQRGCVIGSGIVVLFRSYGHKS